MSDIEYELLGMERPEKRKSTPRRAIAKKRPKLNEAFRYVLSPADRRQFPM